MTDRQLRDEILTLLVAGHETTALALTWTSYLLTRHPEVQVRLRAERVKVLGDRPPSVEDVPRLSYTRALLLESMRLYPPAWSIGLEAVEPCEIGGPRGRADLDQPVDPSPGPAVLLRGRAVPARALGERLAGSPAEVRLLPVWRRSPATASASRSR